jgi:hypothetical protein
LGFRKDCNRSIGSTDDFGFGLFGSVSGFNRDLCGVLSRTVIPTSRRWRGAGRLGVGNALPHRRPQLAPCASSSTALAAGAATLVMRGRAAMLAARHAQPHRQARRSYVQMDRDL